MRNLVPTSLVVMLGLIIKWKVADRGRTEIHTASYCRVVISVTISTFHNANPSGFSVSLSQWKRSVGIKALWITKTIFFSPLLLPTFSFSSLKSGPFPEELYTDGSCTLRWILGRWLTSPYLPLSGPWSSTALVLIICPHSPWSTHVLAALLGTLRGVPHHLGKGQEEISPLPPPVMFQLEPAFHKDSTAQTGRRATRDRDSTPAGFGYPNGIIRSLWWKS